MNNNIADEEQLARIIFSPSFIQEGRVSPTAFRWEMLPSGLAEDYISMLRNDGSNLNTQSEHFRPRTEGDIRYGYALLPANGIRQLDNEFSNRQIELLAKPSRNLPNHAGLFAHIDGEKVTALSPITSEIMLLQKELSLLCSEIIPFSTT